MKRVLQLEGKTGWIDSHQLQIFVEQNKQGFRDFHETQRGI